MISSRPRDPFHAQLDKPVGKGALQRSAANSQGELERQVKLAESDGKLNIIVRNSSSASGELHTVAVDSQETLARLELGQAVKVGKAVGYVVFIDHDGSDDKK